MTSLILKVALVLWSSIFRPVIGSVKGSLIPAELRKAGLAALSASTAVGAAIAAVNAIIPDVPGLFTSPAAAALVTMVLVQAVGVLGQLGQSHTGGSHEGLIRFAERLGYQEEFETRVYDGTHG